MKKRVLMLAVLAGLLALSALPAAAATKTMSYFKIADFDVPDKIYSAAVGTKMTVHFDIVVEAYSTSDSDRYNYANLLKWTVGDSNMDTAGEYFKVTGAKVTNVGVDDSDATDTSEYILEPFTADGNGNVTEPITYTLSIDVTGEILKVGGNIQVKASLWETDGKNAVTEQTKGDATEVEDSANESEEFEITEDKEMDPRGDPDSDSWNGIDPTYTNSKGSAGSKSGKPSLKTSKLEFAAGTYTTKDIEIKGAAPKDIDVYIAAKDTEKLGWFEKKSGQDIRLTKANIKTYHIPFRITGYDITSKDDKNAVSKLTLAFNGAKVAYKGFPLTVEVNNANTGSKPVVKAVKIDVTDNTGVPVWRYDGIKTVAYSDDVYLEDIAEIGTTTDGGKTITKVEGGVTKTATIPSGDSYIEIDDGTVTVSLDNAPEGSKLKVHYDWTQEEAAQLAVDKKTAKEDPDALEVVATVGEDGDGVLTPKTYYVDGDLNGKAIAPYSVTWKAPKDEGIVVTYTQPVYDSYGNVEEHAKITIGGTLAEKSKETKNAITFTAANPSTGKKAALKVTVIGKVSPYFDEDKWVDGYIAAPKYVEEGKLPSVTFKAKGSKTITYELDDDNGELAAQLLKYNLSFDSKKGKVVAINKDNKPKATINDDGEFEPIVLEVLAVNSVGRAPAKALVGVTGKKVKADSASPTFHEGDPVGTTQTIAMKDVAAGADGYKVTFENITKDKKDKELPALSAYGLAIVDTWSNALVSAEVTIKSGDKLPDDFKEDDDRIVSGETKEVEVDGGDNYLVASGDVVIKSGDKTNPDGNKLVLRVTNSGNLATGLKNGKKGSVSFTIRATNYGAETDLKVKVTFEPKSEEKARVASVPAAKKYAGNAEPDTARTGKTGSGKGYTPDTDGEAEADDDADDTEATVTFGAPRTVADLTAEQIASIEGQGYRIVAVLPEITADADGQQDIPVELDEDAPEGAKLIWLPFPKDAGSEDDDIVDFYDDAGASVEGVPASHKIIASPWLRSGVTYAPVIAVEAE